MWAPPFLFIYQPNHNKWRLLEPVKHLNSPDGADSPCMAGLRVGARLKATAGTN